MLDIPPDWRRAIGLAPGPVTALAAFPGFAELKRSLRGRPQLRSFGVDPGAAGA
jgi:hypothetical protein